MKRTCLFWMVAVCAAASVAAQTADVFKVTCRWEEPFTGKVYLSYVDKGLVNLDSVSLSGATSCAFERPLAYADVYRVRTRPYRWDVSILAEPGGRYEVELGEGKAMQVKAERGIRVCGISMDEKREAWERATAEDSIAWTNTCELLPFRENRIAADYKVTQLPTLFLIGPDGTILMQNPTLDDLMRLK